MKLKEFIEKFVEPNTLIRLQYKTKEGHEEVDGDNPQMEHQLARGKFADCEVIGVTDILYLKSNYVEAVNLTICREIPTKESKDNDVTHKPLNEINVFAIKNFECRASQRYSDCHIHADNIGGCLECGNFK